MEVFRITCIPEFWNFEADNASKTHHDKHQQNHFKFHFGGNGNGHRTPFLNFDDLFDDADDNFFHMDPFGDSSTETSSSYFMTMIQIFLDLESQP